jgi:MFS family permease
VPVVSLSEASTTGQPSAGLWSIRAWRYAFPAALVSRLGDIVFDITVVLWISTEIARGQSWAPVAVAGVLIAAAVPVLVVGPLAGVYVDRHDRHRILVVANLVQAAAIGSLLLMLAAAGALSTAAELTWLFGAVAVASAAGQFFTQARMVMIRVTVPDHLRTTAFSVQGSANYALFIVGPPLAAPLLFTAGVGWALAINAASFLVSSVLLALVRWDSAPSPTVAEESFWTSMRDGVRAITGNPLLLAITASITVLTFGTGAINVLEVFFVTEVLHRPASLLGLLNPMFAIGTIAGMLAAPRLDRRYGPARIFLWGVLVCGLFLIAYALTTRLAAAMVLYLLIALPLGVVNTVVMPLFMRTVPPEVMGRATTVLQVFPTVADLLAMGLTGWLVSTVLSPLDVHALGATFGPINTVFVFAGALFVITILAVWSPITRADRRATVSR